MKLINFLFFFILSCQLQVQAQVGVSLSYVNQQTNEWKELNSLKDKNFLRDGFEVAFDYKKSCLGFSSII